ncbi:hypothetical protein H0H92_001445 [Tricholoma furcatifolium]|nr:hypothetical protein H0H92_001445 [Tricholoma furcatifolium]
MAATSLKSYRQIFLLSYWHHQSHPSPLSESRSQPQPSRTRAVYVFAVVVVVEECAWVWAWGSEETGGGSAMGPGRYCSVERWDFGLDWDWDWYWDSIREWDWARDGAEAVVFAVAGEVVEAHRGRRRGYADDNDANDASDADPDPAAPEPNPGAGVPRTDASGVDVDVESGLVSRQSEDVSKGEGEGEEREDESDGGREVVGMGCESVRGSGSGAVDSECGVVLSPLHQQSQHAHQALRLQSLSLPHPVLHSNGIKASKLTPTSA